MAFEGLREHFVTAAVLLDSATCHMMSMPFMACQCASKAAALTFSKQFDEYLAAGLLPLLPRVRGMDKTDASRADMTVLGHGYVASEIEVLDDMAVTIRENKRPEQRNGLVREMDQLTGGVYWRIR